MLSRTKTGRDGGDIFRQARQAERIVTRLRDFGGRKRRGQIVARGCKHGGEIRFRKLGGEIRKFFRRLVEPEIRDEFGGLFGMFEPRRLPSDARN